MIIERNDIHLSNRDAELTYEKGVVGGPVDCNTGDLWAIFVLKMCMKELCHDHSQILNFALIINGTGQYLFAKCA